MKNNESKKGVNILLIFNLMIILVAFIIISNIVSILTFALEHKFEVEISKNLILENSKNFSTYKTLFNVETPINVIGLVILIVFSIKTLFPKKNTNTYEECYDYGSHGTSRWQIKDEVLNNYYRDKKGWFLGSIDNKTKFSNMMNVAYQPVEGELNMQMVVIGAPGSKKTTGFVFPNIFHICDVYKDSEEKADIIVTDPKGEIFGRTSSYLAKNGYDIKVLDFRSLKFGNRLNPIEFINDDETLIEIADGYIKSVQSALGGSDPDPFWNEQSGQLLGALMGFVKQVYKDDKSKQTFDEISRLVTTDDVMDFEKSKTFFIRHNIKGAPLRLWNNFLSSAKSEKTLSGITGNLTSKLKLFAIDGVANLTSSTDIDITLLGRKIDDKKKKPMALFILMKDEDRTFSPIINSIVNILFNQLYATAYETENRLENPVYVILEEMANIGKISGLQERLGTMRGRRIYPMLVWQSLSQMKNRYTVDGMEDIMSQCDTHVYLGINDRFTANYCSESLGETTIKVKNSGNTESNTSESYTYQSRKLLFPSECMALDNNKLIVKQRARNPVLLNKVQYQYWNESICEFKKVSSLEPFRKRADLNENLTNHEYIKDVKECVTFEKVEEEIKNQSDPSPLEKDLDSLFKFER